jgi:hypothetical protein
MSRLFTGFEPPAPANKFHEGNGDDQKHWIHLSIGYTSTTRLPFSASPKAFLAHAVGPFFLDRRTDEWWPVHELRPARSDHSDMSGGLDDAVLGAHAAAR